jgi:hypothetical protein
MTVKLHVPTTCAHSPQVWTDIDLIRNPPQNLRDEVAARSIEHRGELGIPAACPRPEAGTKPRDGTRRGRTQPMPMQRVDELDIGLLDAR